MSRDFDFDTQVVPDNKIDFKKVFFNPEQGLNIIRIVDLKHAQAFRSHFVKTVKGDKRFVKCPGVGCPLCIDGTNKPSTRYLLKVISRKDNVLKVWEFGQQIKVAIEEFVKEIKEDIANNRTDAADTLSDYNIEVRRRAPGTNPLYSLSKKERLSTDPRYAAVVTADASTIAADTINLKDLVKPWSVERIKTQILGLPENAVVTPAAAQAAAPVATAAVSGGGVAVAARPAVVAKPDLAALQQQATAAAGTSNWLDD
jgi:hypothetical protein